MRFNFFLTIWNVIFSRFLGSVITKAIVLAGAAFGLSSDDEEMVDNTVSLIVGFVGVGWLIRWLKRRKPDKDN